MQPGLYDYASPTPLKHALKPAGEVPLVSRGAFTILFEEVSERTTAVYGGRGYMYVREEVGHALQGAVLEASALGLAAAVRGLEPPLGRARYCVDVGARGARIVERKLPEGTLPAPTPPRFTLEEAMVARRSIRSYSPTPLSLSELASVLRWSICGAPRPYPPPSLKGYRTVCYVVVRYVEGLKPGVYRYLPGEHDLEPLAQGDFSRKLARACLSQEWVARAPLNIVLCTPSDDPSAEVEAGMVGQNVYLAAVSIGLGTVAVGAFYDDEVASTLGVDERPLYVLPIGRR